MRCAFNQAKRWELIAKNPFLDATLPEHKERKRGALTPEQLYKVLEFTDQPEIYDRFPIHCAIHLALSCTMRGGEVGGLQWGRVSIEHQAIYIDRVDKKLMMGPRTVIVLKQPKTAGSIRTAYLPETVVHNLETLKHLRNQLKGDLWEDGCMDYGVAICQAALMISLY